MVRGNDGNAQLAHLPVLYIDKVLTPILEAVPLVDLQKAINRARRDAFRLHRKKGWPVVGPYSRPPHKSEHKTGPSVYPAPVKVANIAPAPPCACGGTRLRVSTKPVYRCESCGHTVYKRNDEWLVRSEHAPSYTHHEKHRATLAPLAGVARPSKEWTKLTFGKGVRA